MNEERYETILNLQVEIYDTTVVGIYFHKPLEVESDVYYFYDLLEPECARLNVDFSTLAVCLTKFSQDDYIKVI